MTGARRHGAVARLSGRASTVLLKRPPSRSGSCPATRILLLLSFLTFALTILAALPATTQTKPGKDYLLYVVSESADKIALIRFGPNGARVDHDLQTGDMPVDIDGPHGIVISPDNQFYYVSMAHGRPFGLIWKYSTKDDRVLGKTTLGYFPATVDITPDGNFL